MSQALEVVERLLNQYKLLEAQSAEAAAIEQAVLDHKAQVSQTHEALQAAEAAIAQTVLADATLTNESKRQAALRDAKAKDISYQTLAANFREVSHALSVEQAHLKQVQERRDNLKEYGRHLCAAAELLAADLHNQAQSNRQIASQQYLQGSGR